MFKTISSFKELNARQLMDVYKDSILRGANNCSRDIPEGLRYLEAEQDFLDYMREFFTLEGAFACLWELDGVCVAALRAEPYRDGYLISGLETAPSQRRRGYGKQLLQEAVRSLDAGKIYSHINKKNAASLNLHLTCGFSVISEHAVFLDGSVFFDHYTLCFNK